MDFQKCKVIHGDIIKQLDLWPLTVHMTLSVGTSVLCMAHALMMPYLSVKFNEVCLMVFF